MLKQRLLTAIILIPLFIALLYFMTPLVFSLFTAAVVGLCAWEWSSFMGVQKFPQKLLYPIFVLCLMFNLAALLASRVITVIPFLYVAFIWWLIAIILVGFYPKISRVWGNSLVLRGLMGLLVLIPCWVALNVIRNAEGGLSILLFLFVLIWGADSGAYFAGKAWGKHKLAPAVSPGKTWQGLAGALLTSLVIAVVALYWGKVPVSMWLGAILLALVTVLFSILGDLLESMLKRNAGLKDSGRLLPGHGGILDRIDSLTAAAPIFVLGAMWLTRHIS